MRVKKLLASLVVSVTAMTMITACSASPNSQTEKGQVYYLSPNQQDSEIWNQIAQTFTAQSGIEMRVETVDPDDYQNVLAEKLDSGQAPTLFEVSGYDDLAEFKNYLRALDSEDFTAELTDRSVAISADDHIYAVPYHLDGFGIIYNEQIFDKYFTLPEAVVSSIAEINSFSVLKAVAIDTQSRKDELGISGAFSAPSLQLGEEQSWLTQVVNPAIASEYKDSNASDMQQIKFSYSDNVRQFIDLLFADSTSAATDLDLVSPQDSIDEFASGKSAMLIGSNQDYETIEASTDKTIDTQDLDFLPTFMGLADEYLSGLSIGSTNNFAVNAKVSSADQQASIDFVNWLIYSDQGRDYYTNDLGYVPPFVNFNLAELDLDPLDKAVTTYLYDGSKKNYSWVFQTFPKGSFNTQFAGQIADYANRDSKWDQVAQWLVKTWKAEK